jgi:hypothetical protein
MVPKRMNYFTHQLLREQDFKDEQAYHIEMRRRHNRLFHSWGVVEGLEVVQKGTHEIIVEPGIAIDHEGREILLEENETRDLSAFTHDSEAFITIAYRQEESDLFSAGGIEGYTRVTEKAEVRDVRHDQLDPAAVGLARVSLGEHGHINEIDLGHSFRKVAKVITTSLVGWVRLPFKPVRLNPVRISGKLAGGESSEYDFIVDEATAYCGEHGARGSMQIPVPPGAGQVSGFRIAGITNGHITVRLFRTGWNVREGKGEKSQLLEETVTDRSFHKEVPVQSSLDESHALAVSVKAEGESEIWLVAVRFE